MFVRVESLNCVGGALCTWGGEPKLCGLSSLCVGKVLSECVSVSLCGRIGGTLRVGGGPCLRGWSTVCVGRHP